MATGISKTQWKGADLGTIKENFSQFNPEISLIYEGKKPPEEILSLPPAKCIKINQIGADINQLYYGDNLPILLSFFQQKNYIGKVKLIYIDPPFATQSIFQSRSETDAYCDLLAGSNYLEFLRQRLIVMRELLADDGSIYVHLDENMAFYIKIIMDELFGEKNFRNWITRQKCNPKNFTKKTYGKISDFILFYTKSNDYIWNRPFIKWTEERSQKEYPYIDEITGRRYKKVPIHAPGKRNGETGKPWRTMNPPPGKHWQFTPKTLDEMDAKGDIYWSKNGNPRRKIYLDESLGISVQDIWYDYKDAHNQNVRITGYPTEKNQDLLSRIIQTSSHPNDLILDCFAGSGTTLSVASQLGRRWIGIDDSREAIFTMLKRFTQGCEFMGDFVNPKNQQNHQQLSLFGLDDHQYQFHLVKDYSLHTLESLTIDLSSINHLFNIK